jgi:tellurite resistance protein TehA-like permease
MIFSLLASGENLSHLLPVHLGGNFPETTQSGQILFGVAFAGEKTPLNPTRTVAGFDPPCFSGAYICWSAGFCWVIIGCIAIGNQLRKGKIPFSLAYWGMIFPHGVYARLCCQLAKVLDSEFFRGYAAFWCGACFISPNGVMGKCRMLTRGCGQF